MTQLSRASARTWIVAGLAAFAFTSYMARSNISIASEAMIPALGLSKIQMGQVFSAFLVGYALFQIAGGAIGDRFGARLTLGISALIWSATSLATGLVPFLFAGRPALLFVALWMIRFILGLSEATTFPVGNTVVRNWMPPHRRGLGNSIMFLGTASASAAVAPLVSVLMVRLGWQASFYITAILPLALAVLWLLLARDHPADKAVTDFPTSRVRLSPRELASVVTRRNALLLIASYTSEGYVLFIFVFWMYIYLVEQRGLSLGNAGWISAIPWLVAVILTPLGGYVCDRIGRVRGRAIGSRAVIVAGYSLSGILLYLAAAAHLRWVCVAALSLSIAALMAAEAGFWSYAAHLGREHSGLLSGIMNTAGILGGIASTSLVPIIVQHVGWLPALATGTVMAFLCTVTWFFIREP